MLEGEKLKLLEINPMEIEKRSFAIIEEELRSMGIELSEDKKHVYLRAIHTSADFDYARNLVFSNDALERGEEALKGGTVVITDTNMGKSGINKQALKKLGCGLECFMADEQVAALAKERHVTRAIVSMEQAAKLYPNGIYVIGNAPTALIRLGELIDEGKCQPALVIGVPVGFVNVVESKEWIMTKGVPYIVAKGRKGGSNIGAAICNAMMYKLTRT